MRDEPLSQEEFRVTEQKKVRRKRWKQRFKNFGLYCIILPSCGLARLPTRTVRVRAAMRSMRRDQSRRR